MSTITQGERPPGPAHERARPQGSPMPEQFQRKMTPEDASAFTENIARIAERSRRVLEELGWLQANPAGEATDISKAFLEAMTRLNDALHAAPS